MLKLLHDGFQMTDQRIIGKDGVWPALSKNIVSDYSWITLRTALGKDPQGCFAEYLQDLWDYKDYDITTRLERGEMVLEAEPQSILEEKIVAVIPLPK